MLKLKENGELAKLKNKWWYDNTECHETTEKAKASNVWYFSSYAGFSIYYMCTILTDGKPCKTK